MTVRKSRKNEQESAATDTMRSFLLDRTSEAVEVLVELMRDKQQKPELRMKAAESILDRAYGKSGSAFLQGGEANPTGVCFEGVLEEWSR